MQRKLTATNTRYTEVQFHSILNSPNELVLAPTPWVDSMFTSMLNLSKLKSAHATVNMSG